MVKSMNHILRQSNTSREDGRIVPGMFAPEVEEQIPLQHCIRVYPHQQDTGGFFIAALEKLSEIRAKPESESKSMMKNWKFNAPTPTQQLGSEHAISDAVDEDMDHPMQTDVATARDQAIEPRFELRI